LIALFRGINVGGKSSLPMIDLQQVLEKLGAINVQTYIQSGNAVFDYPGQEISCLSDSISSEVFTRRGFKPAVLILSRAELMAAMLENPFKEAEAEGSSLHLGFLAAKPERVDLTRLDV